MLLQILLLFYFADLLYIVLEVFLVRFYRSLIRHSNANDLEYIHQTFKKIRQLIITQTSKGFDQVYAFYFLLESSFEAMTVLQS